MNEGNILVTVRNNQPLAPIAIPMEEIILLFEKPLLLSFLLSLKVLQRAGKLNLLTQDKLAKELGMSKPTFIQHRDALAETEIITVTKEMGKIIIQINEIHLHVTEARRLKGFPYAQGTQLEFFRRLRNKLIILTPEKRKEQEREELVNNLVDDKIKKIKKEVARKEGRTYPNEDYDAVLLAYTKWKHVGFKGDDFARAKRTIKSMFNSGHTVREIILCIEDFAKHSTIEGNEWVASCKLEGIMKNIAEWKAGAIKWKRRMEDDYPDL